jgi:hypothetical protein
MGFNPIRGNIAGISDMVLRCPTPAASAAGQFKVTRVCCDTVLRTVPGFLCWLICATYLSGVGVEQTLQPRHLNVLAFFCRQTVD